MISSLTTLQQFILFSSSVLATGCVAWRLFVAPAAAADVGPAGASRLHASEARVATVALAAAGAVVAGWAMRGSVQLLAFRDPFVPITEDVDLLLFQTFWGTVWMVQGAVVVLLAGSLGLARAVVHDRSQGDARPLDGSRWWRLSAVLVLLLAATLAASGHAMGADSGRPLALTADGLHALAAGGWIGTLAAVLVASRTGGEDDTAVALAAAQLRRFSPLALVCGTTLVGMGAVLSWTHLQTLSDLWTSSYGRLLSAKVGLAAVVFGLGFVNWRRGLPSLDTAAGSVAVRRRAVSEVVLAGGVLLLTALLVHATKP